MKKAMNRAIIAIMSLALTGILLTGCGTNQQNPEPEVSPIIPLETQGPVAAEPIEEAVEATEETPAAAEEPAKEPQQETERFEDNFAVSSEAAKEFAMKIQDVTARKDLEGLAALTSFPVYVGLAEVGGVETKDELLSLGADALFTEQLMESVAMADIDNLQPSRAGFSISNGGTANIIFGVVNGVLAISGINY